MSAVDRTQPPQATSTGTLLDRIQQDWKAVHPDLDTSAMVTLIALNRTSALIMRALDTFFTQYNLSASAFDVLATLRRSAPPEGLNFTHLAELMAVTPPAVTKRIDRLVEQQLVERIPSAEDRRASFVRLTEQGRAVVNDVLPRHLENEERILAQLTGQEQRLLHHLLLKLSQAL